MSSRLLVIALALVSCTKSQGQVLTSLGVDAGDAPPVDAAESSSDAAPTSDCDDEPVCPPPGNSEFTICGRVYDLQTSAPVTGGAGSPGPELHVRAWDPLTILSDLITGNSLTSVTPDACGRFTAASIAVPLQDRFVIGTDSGDFSSDDYRIVYSMVPVSGGNTVRVNVFALRRETDTLWAQGAGLGGQTFASAGSFLGLFTDVALGPMVPLAGTPVPGVVIVNGGDDNTADDYYFADTDMLSRAAISAEPDTASNGSALLRNSPFGKHSGDKSGCSFDEVDRVLIPGALQVQEIRGSCQ